MLLEIPSGGIVEVWTLLDNAHAPVAGELVLEARRLADGQVLERWAKWVELRPDQRSVSLSAPLGQLAPAETLLSATFLGTQTVRLLVEPKHANLPVPGLSASRHPDGILIETDRPAVDLCLWDPEGHLTLLDNFVTLPAAGRRVLRARGNWTELWGRSLAGRHRVA